MAKIKALIKASYKQLKDILTSKFKKHGLVFLILNINKFSLINYFFPNLAKFWDLDNFSNFCGFLFGFLLFNPITILLPLFFSKTNILLLFLLNSVISGNLVIFNIKIYRDAILLKS